MYVHVCVYIHICQGPVSKSAWAPLCMHTCTYTMYMYIYMYCTSTILLTQLHMDVLSHLFFLLISFSSYLYEYMYM